MTTKAQARSTYYSSITQKDPRLYKEELSSPKKIDHTKITFDFLNESKVCLTMDQRSGVKKSFGTIESPQRARFTDT